MDRKMLHLAVLVGLTTLNGGAWAQTTIETDGDIETDAQLISNVATGTAPLAVSSTTMVSSLNADQVDGVEGTALALDADLQSVETMLVALQAQVDALGTAPVPQTGQTTCYDAAGTVTTCGTGIGLAQDGDLQLGVSWPNPRFTKNGDGTVTDNLTGLIWLENANCAAATMDWAAALNFANTLFDGSVAHNGGDCGLSDTSAVGAWRLPNVRELQSLVHSGVSSPAVPNTAGTGQWVAGDPFSGVQSHFYWSSTADASNTANAWLVQFAAGNVIATVKTSGSVANVWLVRGGQFNALGTAPVPRTGQTTCYDAAGAVTTCGTGIGLGQDGDLQLGVSWPNPRFTDNGDGTVTDNLTGLIWLEDANCANGPMDWENALSFANTLFDGSSAHNGGDCGLSDTSAVGAWRLPNVRELQSLVHSGVSSPAVPNTAGTGKWTAGDPFASVQSSYYWSSATAAYLTPSAWVVNMNTGFTTATVKTNTSFPTVWLVRGGQ